jgi:invasion protein IalB
MQGSDKARTISGRTQPTQAAAAGSPRAAPSFQRAPHEESWENAVLTDIPDAAEEAERGGNRLASPANSTTVLWGIIAVLALIIVGLLGAYFTGLVPSTGSGQTATADSATPQAAPEEVVKQATYGDWTYACVKAGSGGDVRCVIAQQLVDSKSKAPLFRWRIVRDDKGGMIGEWDTPSGMLVNQGIVLDAGWDKPARIPFQTCVAGGCRATASLAPDAIDRLAKAEKAVVTLFPAGGNAGGVQIGLSVKGLPEALAALREAR